MKIVKISKTVQLSQPVKHPSLISWSIKDTHYYKTKSKNIGEDNWQPHTRGGCWLEPPHRKQKWQVIPVPANRKNKLKNVKCGGFGLQDQVQLSPAAYLAGLEQAVPFFGGEKGICPPLGQLGGGSQGVAERWKPLLEGGGRTAREFKAAWEVLTAEAREMCSFLNEDLTGALALPVEGAGDGSTDGGTRKAVVTQLENLRHRMLSKHLKEWQVRTDRPVWSWPNRDKLSTSWLLSFPGPHSGQLHQSSGKEWP